MNFDLSGAASVVANPSPTRPFMYSSRAVPQWPPLLKRWSEGKEDRRRKRLLNVFNGMPGRTWFRQRTNVSQRNTLLCGKAGGSLLYCPIYSLPPNPAGKPMNQWATAPPITLPLPCLYTAAVLYIPPPRDPTPHCTGTMSFLKVISSLALGQPSSWVHYAHAHTHTRSSKIHCLNTPLLVSLHCSTAHFCGSIQCRPGTHTHKFGD